jgi:hypothetical protein
MGRREFGSMERRRVCMIRPSSVSLSFQIVVEEKS